MYIYIPYGAKIWGSIIFAVFADLLRTAKIYAPRNNAKFSKTRMHTLPQLQIVGDRSVVVYRLNDSPTMSCPILEVPCQGIGSTETHDLGASEKAAHTLRSLQSKNRVA